MIKFRAFDDGKMFYSHNNSFNEYNFQLQWFFKTVRRDAIIMQFSGIKDKDGVDIYEGDHLQTFSEGVLFYKVVFENAAFVLYHNFGYWGTLQRFMEVTDKKFVDTGCVVIGNIYENAELSNVQPG